MGLSQLPSSPPLKKVSRLVKKRESSKVSWKQQMLVNIQARNTVMKMTGLTEEDLLRITN
ncbi:hypothetical protein G3601_004635 [Salmonella enterica]|nr:hypothetical protein [Salmonella enterica]ECD6404040.1 hypothetical protein [Salmonella enterica subsp. enterica serovar Java]EDQ0182515.1 hypothetical protein [Salmonella enterica subsp. enterica serovar 4,[5],12:b:-]EAQ4528372.1 hypothetical protein [Salmonella enterica]EAS1291831.1 hypothetical protein [Salmonella enterica]